MPYQSEDHFMSRKHVWSVPLTTENVSMHHLEIEALYTCSTERHLHRMKTILTY